MNLQKLYMALSTKERQDLLEILKAKQESFATDLTASDWVINNVWASTRLFNVVNNSKKLREMIVKDITKKDFMAERMTGEQTWKEFVKLRGF